MTIQEYISILEDTKKKLIDLNLPLDTKLVHGADMGFHQEFFGPVCDFTPTTAYKKGKYFYKYQYVCDEKLTEIENVVVVRP